MSTSQWAGGQQGGIWNISHSSENNSYYQAYLNNQVGAETPVALMGGAITQGPNLPKTYMAANYKLTWMEMRKAMHDLFMDNSGDPGIISQVQQVALYVTPVRTGRLVDYMMATMRINRTSWYTTTYNASFSYETPPDRPIPVTGKIRHSPPDRGYGDWSGIKLISGIKIPNVHIDHVTMMGNALYILNDPESFPDPRFEINKAAQTLIRNQFAKNFTRTIITAML